MKISSQAALIQKQKQQLQWAKKTIFLLLSFHLFVACNNETAEQAYKRGYKEGHQVGYEEGHEKGYKEGHKAGYRAFVAETWKPTLAGVTIGGIGILGAIGVLYFFVIPGFKNIRARGIAREMLTSARGIQLLTPKQSAIIRDLRNAEDIFQKTSLYLQRNLQRQFDQQDRQLRNNQNNELSEVSRDIKRTKSDLVRISHQIKNIENRYHELRLNEAKSTIKEIAWESSITPNDRIILLDKLKTHYKI